MKYFYDAILHELGHAYGLGHINDTLSLTYWYSAAYRPTITSGGTYPGPATLEGGLDMVNTSSGTSPASLGCGSYSILSVNARDCIDSTLSINDISEDNYNLSLYPNPTDKESITIAYNLIKNSSVQFNIVDCIGRIIMKLNNGQQSQGHYTEQVNIDGLAEGVYLFTANINGELQVIKFIKL